MKYLVLFLWVPIWLICQNKELDSLVENINPQGFTGLSLYDSSKNEFVYDYNSEKYFTPASNLKVLSLASRIMFNRTDSIATAQYAFQQDTLYLYPLADPTFWDDRFSSKNLEKLLKSDNYSTLCIINEDDTKNITAYAPGWSWDDFDQSYMPERSLLPIYKNLYHKDLEFYFEKDKLKTSRQFHQNSFGSKSEEVPFIVDNLLISTVLNKKFNKEVIFIDKSPQLEFKILYSNPSKPVLQEMMLESDNFIAEQLFLNTALVFGISPNEMRKAFDAYLNITPKWVDASGLSRYDLISPKDMVSVLGYIQSELPNYLSYFPENGKTGTLEHSYTTEKSYLFAKTGSMGGVYNLSGYLKTKSGKVLIFSLMNNNFTEKGRNLKPRIEKLLLYLKHQL